MRSRWAALRANLVASTRSLEALKRFRELRERHSALGGFDEPVAVLDHLADDGANLDEKDRVLAALVEDAHALGDAGLASTLLALGLWPALDGIYRRHLGWFRREPDELASLVIQHFAAAVAAADMSRITRVASTLVRNTQRRLRDGWRRARSEAACRDDLPDDDRLSAEDGGQAPRAASRLGFVVDLATVDEDVKALRPLLARVVGADADIVLAVDVLGLDQAELSRYLGIGHDAVRKRYQRALGRLRQHFRARRSLPVPLEAAEPRSSFEGQSVPAPRSGPGGSRGDHP